MNGERQRERDSSDRQRYRATARKGKNGSREQQRHVRCTKESDSYDNYDR